VRHGVKTSPPVNRRGRGRKSETLRNQDEKNKGTELGQRTAIARRRVLPSD